MIKSHSLLRGALILSAAGLISKVLGALYRIPFSHMVGQEGIGLYQMAYPIYTMLLAISTAGIPVAISKMIAECIARGDYQAPKKILSVSLVFLALFGALCSAMLLLSARFIADWILRDPRAYYPLSAIAPAILLVSIMAVFRGYFQGLQRMGPTAASQIIEQVFRVTTVLAGAYFFLPMGATYTSAIATFGAATGAFAGVVLLWLIYINDRNGYNKKKNTRTISTGSVIARLVTLAFPISLAGLVMPLMQTIDAVIVPMRLQSMGVSVAKATGLYGQLTGMAGTLVNLPTIVTLALATSLVPAVSRAMAAKNYYQLHKQTGGAVRISIMICLPAATGLALLADPLSSLLFACPEAASPLQYLAPGALFLGLHQATSGILQGLGKTFIPVRNLLIGAIFKLAANYYLTAIPLLGIKGAALGTVIGFMVASWLNFRSVVKCIGWNLEVRDHLLKPVLAATIMGMAVIFCQSYLAAYVSLSKVLGISVLGGFLVYGFVLLVTGGIKRNDLSLIPWFGTNLASLLTRLGLLRG